MSDKIIGNTNPYLHSFKLIAIDILIMLAIGFCNNLVLWILFKAAPNSHIPLGLYSIVSTIIIWIVSSLPFYLKYKAIHESETNDEVKLKNYKRIMLLNTILVMIFIIKIVLPFEV